MKKQKIIFTVINDLNYDQRMIRICKSLVKNNYEVLLVGRKLSHSQPLQTQPFQQKRLNCFFEKGKLFYLEYNLRLFFFLMKKKYDGVCAIDLDTILPVFYVAKWRGKKMIYDAHEYFTEVPEVARRPKVKSVWEWVAQKTIPMCTHCYTVGESLAEIFQKRYGTPFEVIRNVPSRHRMTFQSSNDFSKKDQEVSESSGDSSHWMTGKSSDDIRCPIILYQGALNEGRGLEEMLEAMTELENVELWLAGEGDLSQVLRKKTKELQIGNKVKFLGYLFPEELKRITPQATIGINLLKNNSLNYFYSLANKTFDYVQAEVPAIHMKFPEYEKIMDKKEVGILVEDLEKETLVNAVNKLLSNDVFYQALKLNCKEASKIWNWEIEEKKLLDFYKKVFRN